jgi:hypothetical protein
VRAAFGHDEHLARRDVDGAVAEIDAQHAPAGRSLWTPHSLSQCGFWHVLDIKLSPF